MSQYERYKGKIIKIELKNKTLEDKCKEICESIGLKLNNDYYDSYKKLLEDSCSEEYLVTKNALYKIESERLDIEDTFCKIKNNDDGTYNFHTMFHNGGTCLVEMLEDEIGEMEG